MSYPRLHLTWLTPARAMAHTRRAYNVPADVGVGWRPYTILVTTPGATSITAFHSARELGRWLAATGRVLRLKGRGLGPNGSGIRTGWVTS